MATLYLPDQKKWTLLTPEVLPKWDARMKALCATDRVAIIHDADPDGICAAVILTKLVERIRRRSIDLRLEREEGSHSITRAMISQLKKHKITHVITADLAVEQDLQTLQDTAEFAQVIIIDHHKMMNTLQHKNILLIKPQLVWKEPNPAYYATAKLAYDLGSRIADLSDIEWVAGAGLIGDSGFMQWYKYLQSLLKKLGIAKRKNWYDTELGNVASTISLALCYNKKLAKSCYKELLNAKKWKQFNKSSLAKYKTAVENELKKHIQKFSKLKAQQGIHLYELKPRYQITGTLSTILAHKHPNKTVIIANLAEEPIRISARRNDSKIAINDLLTNSVKGIPGAQGGGHIPSAGAIVPKKYYTQFKQNLFANSLKIMGGNGWRRGPHERKP